MTIEPETVGQRLRNVRLKNNLGQQHVAQELGIDAAVLSRHERGRRRVPEETAIRYAQYYGVPVDYLLDGPQPKPAPANVYLEGTRGNIPVSGIPKTRGERLLALRKDRGFVKLTPTAKLIGVNPITMAHHEKGLREITRQAAELYARFFGVPAGYILFGEDLPKTNYVNIIGHISAGGRVNDMPTVTPGEEQRISIAPLVPITDEGAKPEDIVAYVVQGDELYPSYFDGDVVLVEKVSGEISPLDVNSCECVVTLPSGEKLLRIVKPEGEGRYTIFGYNVPPQFGIRLVAAWPVVQITRSRRRRRPGN